MKVALIGNPNSGKTTLFNSLTGLKQHVGNWPGKTIEKKEAFFGDFKIIDLPGVYSLSSHTLEEQVTEEFLLKEKPDLILNIIDATNIERSLYLTIQLLEKGFNVVIALNLIDYAEAQGIRISKKVIEEILGVKVIAIDASKPFDARKKLSNFKQVKPRLEINNKDKPNLINKRYQLIDSIIKRAVIKEHKRNLNSFIDNIVLNKFLALPIFFAVMFLLFKFTFDMSSPISALIEQSIDMINQVITNFLSQYNISGFVVSFITKGVIQGIGAVLVFVPVILILFFLISLLEDSGYLARVAFIMDKPMSLIGLNGKAFIPFLLGFGCNVPSIMATRIMEREEERKLAMFLIPFISCSGKLPVYLLFASLFFKTPTLVIISLYLLGILIIFLVGAILSRTFFRGAGSYLLMEMPLYKIPNLKNAFIHTWNKGKMFLVKAGTIIFLSVVIIWILATLPLGAEYASKESLIGKLGQAIAPIFKPLGFGRWDIAVALIFGVVAKEVIVGSLATIHNTSLNSILLSYFTPISAYAFLVFILLYSPCLATLATIKKETGSWSFMLRIALFLSLFAWAISFLVKIFLGLFL
jgi:ferrous iron transport protein B